MKTVRYILKQNSIELLEIGHDDVRTAKTLTVNKGGKLLLEFANKTEFRFVSLCKRYQSVEATKEMWSMYFGSGNSWSFLSKEVMCKILVDPIKLPCNQKIAPGKTYDDMNFVLDMGAKVIDFKNIDTKGNHKLSTFRYNVQKEIIDFCQKNKKDGVVWISGMYRTTLHAKLSIPYPLY